MGDFVCFGEKYIWHLAYVLVLYVQKCYFKQNFINMQVMVQFIFMHVIHIWLFP